MTNTHMFMIHIYMKVVGNKRRNASKLIFLRYSTGESGMIVGSFWCMIDHIKILFYRYALSYWSSRSSPTSPVEIQENPGDFPETYSHGKFPRNIPDISRHPPPTPHTPPTHWNFKWTFLKISFWLHLHVYFLQLSLIYIYIYTYIYVYDADSTINNHCATTRHNNQSKRVSLQQQRGFGRHDCIDFKPLRYTNVHPNKERANNSNKQNDSTQVHPKCQQHHNHVNIPSYPHYSTPPLPRQQPLHTRIWIFTCTRILCFLFIPFCVDVDTCGCTKLVHLT